MPGVVVVPQLAPIACCIDDLVLLAACGDDTDCDAQVIYLPL